MRRVFAGTIVTGVAAALLFGGVFAWTASDGARGVARVGENAFSISYEPHCDGPVADIADAVAIDDLFDADATADPGDAIVCYTLVGPAGSSTPVGRGIGHNEGDYDLVVTAGHLRVHRVQGGGECSPSDFSGDVRLLDPGQVIQPGESGGGFIGVLTVSRSAPSDCQGKFLGYRILIEADNPVLFRTEDGLRESDFN